MWLKSILFIICLTLFNNSLSKIKLSLGEPIPDIEYEQVIADRYLFSQFSNESIG